MATFTRRRKSNADGDKTIETLADLVDRLGGVPLHRISLKPPPGQAKVADVVRFHEKHDRLCELVDGTLVEKGMGFIESVLAVVLGTALVPFVSQRNLGLVVGAAAAVELLPNLVSIPDVSVVLWERIPGRRIPQEPIPALARISHQVKQTNCPPGA